MQNTNLNDERKNARISIYSELLFVFTPFIAMIIIFIHKGEIDTVFSSPEWSLASAVLSGQAMVRFNSGLTKYRGDRNWQVAQIYNTIVIIMLFVPSLIIFSIAQTVGSLSTILAIGQFILFILSVMAFVLLGSIGQWLLDKPEDRLNLLSNNGDTFSITQEDERTRRSGNN